MIPRDKTHRMARGELVLFSPPRGITWRYRFGIQPRRLDGNILLTAAQARRLAADLLRRAEDLEARKEA